MGKTLISWFEGILLWYFGEIQLWLPFFLVRNHDNTQNNTVHPSQPFFPGTPPMGPACRTMNLLLGCLLSLGLLHFPGNTPAQTTDINPKGSFWSWQPLKGVSIPPLPPSWPESLKAWDTNPLDRFVANGLAKEGWIGSVPADPATLLRRVHLDLVGTPPRPEDLTRFLADHSEKAFEAEVNRLLASQAYGQRWARHWLDVARFAESHGFEYDRPRDHAWRYRDWVVEAFNNDICYLDFVQFQLAGDLLPGANANGLIATGFLVSGPYDQAGNGSSSKAIRERAREDELEELVGTTSQAFLGLTVHCARCHDHKFDPISLTEYHQFKAALSGVRRGDRGIKPAADPNQSKAERDAYLEKMKKIDQELEFILSKASTQSGTPLLIAIPRLRYSFWKKETPVGELVSGAKLTKDSLVLNGMGAFFRSPPLAFEMGQKTLEAWVHPANLSQRGGGVVGIETLDGTQFDTIVLGELEAGVWVAGSNGHVRTLPLATLGASRETASSEFIHLAAVYHSDGTIQMFRNGVPYGASYKPKANLFRTTPGQVRVVVGLRHFGGGTPYFAGEIAEARVHTRALLPFEVLSSYRAGPRADGTTTLLNLLRPEDLEKWQILLEKRTKLEMALKPLPEPDPQVFSVVSTPPGIQKILTRGDIERPQGDAKPGALKLLTHAPADFALGADSPDAARRLALARWIGNKDNPLLARVWVNRLWQYHFGTGLVDSSSDFGHQGTHPTHPELLDFLANTLKDNGFKTKPLHKLIVMSQTYRQSSADRPLEWKKDAQTRLLWRYPPRRLDAEAIRDSMLFISGELGQQAGGPGIRPFTIQAFNSVFYKPVETENPAFLARSIYLMVIRSARNAILEAFDCPDPTVRTARRNQTTTPIQALALMNDPFVQKRSQQMAATLIKETDGNLEKAVEQLWLRGYSRPINPVERNHALFVAKNFGLESVSWAIFNSSEFLDLR